MSDTILFAIRKHFTDITETRQSIEHITQTEIKNQFFCIFPKHGVTTILVDCQLVLNTLSLGKEVGRHFLADQSRFQTLAIYHEQTTRNFNYVVNRCEDK